jgi:hypothetical protein
LDIGPGKTVVWKNYPWIVESKPVIVTVNRSK